MRRGRPTPPTSASLGSPTSALRCGSSSANVRWIGDDHVVDIVDCRVPIADDARSTSSACVVALRRAIASASAEISVAVTRAIAARALDGERNGAGTGTEIQHAAVSGDALQRELDQQFGFGTRNQYVGRDLEHQIPEVASSGDVGDRSSGAVSLQHVLDASRVDRCQASHRRAHTDTRDSLRARAQSTLRRRAALRSVGCGAQQLGEWSVTRSPSAASASA